MKILIVSVDFPPHTDGVSTVTYEVARRLRDAGEEVMVIGPKSKGDKEYDSKHKFKVIRTPWYELGYIRFIPIFFVMPLVIWRNKIKMVIPMNIAYGGIISYLFFKILGFSYILWAYGYEFGKFEKNKFLKSLYLRIYKNALFVNAITGFVKQRLIKFGVPSDKIIVIRPGTDPKKFYPLPIDEGLKRKYNLENKKVILSVGRLVERKGMDMTIKALKDILKVMPDTVYLIVGEGPFRKNLETVAYQEGMLSKVHFLGRVSDDELLKLYNLSDLFVMPSRTLQDKGDSEGFGIVFLEAGACGKPVIGGLDGGMNEAVESGVSGLLVNPNNTKDISNAIIKILSDKDYARFLGENGRRRVLDELNWERAVKTFHEHLRTYSQ